ncbi:MAG: hypothetical protein AAF127_14710 [Pseudomonadota bacterium]
MVLSTDVRKSKLIDIKESGESQGKQKLYYMGETQSFDVYRIDLDHLIYNRHNGRIEAEMLTWEQENAAPIGTYDGELHQKIGTFLWDSNRGRNKTTLADLNGKGQQRPGIVSLDGVIIDGNRRAMLLRKLEDDSNKKQYFDAIILPHAYADNQAEIVRLETQYQLGEDAKVDYGPLQKYLHARRLHDDLNIKAEEIDTLMGASRGNTKKLLAIMQLMDDYLEHIGCPRLYLMLKDSDGTKEGMFVDLYADLKRIESGKAKIPWAFDPEIDPLQLRLIQFDYIRLGDFADAKKVYREISHQGKDRNFFASQDIWEQFRDSHTAEVDPITMEMGALESYLAADPDAFATKLDAARARDKAWRAKVNAPMKRNFGQSSYKLNLATEVLKPGEYLKRAKDQLDKIDLESDGVLSSPENEALAVDIGRIAFSIKKRFDRRVS